MSTTIEAISGCGRCSLHESCNRIVLPNGPTKTPYMIVGDTPSLQEDAIGEAQRGQGGLMLDKLLRSAGIERDACYVTTAVKCRPQGRQPRAAEVKACRQWLDREIEEVDPKVILAIGARPAKLLLGLGSDFRLEDYLLKPEYIGAGLKVQLMIAIKPLPMIQKGSMRHVKQVVKALTGLRNYVEKGAFC